MRTRTSLSLAALAATAALASGLVGCGRRSCDQALYASPGATNERAGTSSSGGVAGTDPAAAARAISEADIVQLDYEQNWIYAMSKSGSLAIVDASQPKTLTLKGKGKLVGQPFEMYRRGDVLLTMSNSARRADGSPVPVLSDGAAPPTADPNGGAVISAISVADPAHITSLKDFAVPGEIADSRIVGDVLYLATYENAACYQCGKTARTLITTFDISDATSPKQIDQVGFDAPQTAGMSLAWSTPWKRSIIATSERLYVGGLATGQEQSLEGVIQVLDITDPTGHLRVGAKIATSGPVMSRWQMDESDGVFRVISQVGAGRSGNGEKFPDIDTFRIESTQSIVRVGHTTLTLPRMEGLKTVRFDGPRAYAITFNQTDPLFAIDLSDPANPQQKGELQMPGWMYHLEPRGDRVIGLGLDRTDASGNLNVSLFDVSNMASPKLIKRASFGPSHLYEDYQITNGVIAEDQDRIQKAFRLFDDGLIVVPYSAHASSGDTCTGGGGIQLLEWSRDSLSKRGLVTMDGNARRAIRRDSGKQQELIGVSDSNVTSYSIDLRDAPSKTADVVIGTCVAKSDYPTGGVGVGDNWEGGRDAAYGLPWDGEACE